MPNYKHILVATDFSKKSYHTVNAALHLGQLHGATVSIIHFIEPLPATAFAYTSALDIDKERSIKAKKLLSELATELNIPADNQYIKEGLPKSGITHAAKELQADLLVVGNHGHHLTLLGSTANAVSQHAHCDVLIVR